MTDGVTKRCGNKMTHFVSFTVPMTPLRDYADSHIVGVCVDHLEVVKKNALSDMAKVEKVALKRGYEFDIKLKISTLSDADKNEIAAVSPKALQCTFRDGGTITYPHQTCNWVKEWSDAIMLG